MSWGSEPRTCFSNFLRSFLGSMSFLLDQTLLFNFNHDFLAFFELEFNNQTIILHDDWPSNPPTGRKDDPKIPVQCDLLQKVHRHVGVRALRAENRRQEDGTHSSTGSRQKTQSERQALLPTAGQPDRRQGLHQGLYQLL